VAFLKAEGQTHSFQNLNVIMNLKSPVKIEQVLRPKHHTMALEHMRLYAEVHCKQVRLVRNKQNDRANSAPLISAMVLHGTKYTKH